MGLPAAQGGQPLDAETSSRLRIDVDRHRHAVGDDVEHGRSSTGLFDDRTQLGRVVATSGAAESGPEIPNTVDIEITQG